MAEVGEVLYLIPRHQRMGSQGRAHLQRALKSAEVFCADVSALPAWIGVRRLSVSRAALLGAVIITRLEADDDVYQFAVSRVDTAGETIALVCEQRTEAESSSAIEVGEFWIKFNGQEPQLLPVHPNIKCFGVDRYEVATPKAAARNREVG